MAHPHERVGNTPFLKIAKCGASLQRMKTLIMAILMACALGAGMAIGANTQLHAGTKTDLSTAMHGEAFAYAKYMLYAKHAREAGNPQLAQLFEQTASIELNNHFATHAYEYGLVGSDQQNLRDAIAGENYETTTMYPGMAKRAQAAGDTKVGAIFLAIAKDEGTHRGKFQAALNDLSAR